MENTVYVNEKLGEVLDNGFNLLFRSIHLGMLSTVLEAARASGEIDEIEYKKESKWIMGEADAIRAKLKEVEEEGDLLSTLSDCGITVLEGEEIQ